jgi:acid stress chaperone HdeB
MYPTLAPFRTTILFAAIASVVSCVMPAQAQVILDMSLITCGEYLKSDPERQELVAAWMSGYFNASRNQPMLSFERFEYNKKSVTNYCKTHKPETLMNAILVRAR